jgi:hypothetical protein
MKKMPLAVLFLSFSALAWEPMNNPSQFSRNYKYKFSDLPKSANLSEKNMPWSNSYWPGMIGGIAFRWNDTMPETNIGFTQFHNYPVLSESQVKRMSYDDLKKLSPAEKYDLYLGNYDFKLTKIVKGETSPQDAYWEGLCNGWSSAAIEFDEPKPVDMRNPDGMVIPFGTSDLKALLSYYHNSLGSKQAVTRIGNRCNMTIAEGTWSSDANIPADCTDINPGALHVVLANQLGLMDEGFVAEVTRDLEIWNQPVYGYEITKEEEVRVTQPATPGTVKQIEINLNMHYADDGGYEYWLGHEEGEEIYVDWEPTTGTVNFKSEHQEYKYLLDLDRLGNIIGGRWLTYNRPDFIWKKTNKGFMSKGPLKDTMTGNRVKYLWSLQNLVEIR